MNNIFLNQDPLLYNNNQKQESILPPYEYYRIYQQQQQGGYHDWVNELNHKIKSLEPSVINELNNNSVYVGLASDLNIVVQNELTNLIKNNLNTNIEVIDNIKKQLNIINDVENKTKEAERQNLNELNDYMNNYSDITFNEYKKIKSNGISVQDKKKHK